MFNVLCAIIREIRYYHRLTWVVITCFYVYASFLRYPAFTQEGSNMGERCVWLLFPCCFFVMITL